MIQVISKWRKKPDCHRTVFFLNMTKRHVIVLFIPKWIWLTPMNSWKGGGINKRKILKRNMKMQVRMQLKLKNMVLYLQWSLLPRESLIKIISTLLSMWQLFKTTRSHGRLSMNFLIEIVLVKVKSSLISFYECLRPI